jgi:hypothetical protein
MPDVSRPRRRSLRGLVVASAVSVAVIVATCGTAFGLLHTLRPPIVDQRQAAQALAVVEKKRVVRSLVWIGSAPPRPASCRALGRRDVAVVGRSVRIVVIRGRPRQTRGARLSRRWLVALSILAGCPHQLRFLLSERLGAAFSHDQARLLERNRVGRSGFYEITISRRPSIELALNQVTLEPVGARLQGRGQPARSTFVRNAVPVNPSRYGQRLLELPE